MVDLQNVHWTNQQNARYYEMTPIETHQNFAKRGGLSSYSDLSLIQDYISRAASILEVGACYGRVIDYLLQSGFPGEITAVERSQSYIDFLKSKYRDASVNLIHADAAKFCCDKKFDLILWMWSGISDFTPEEQFQVLEHLSLCLSPGGFLIIDTFSPFERPLNAESSQNQSYTVQVKDWFAHGYIPSVIEIRLYAQSLGFFVIHETPYMTSENRPRMLYVLLKRDGHF